MGTVVVTPESGRHPQRIGTRLQFDGVIALSTTYATNGDTINASSLGMSEISGGIVNTFDNVTLRIVPQTPPSTAKLKGTVTSTGAELGNGTDQHTITPFAMIVGR